MKMNFNSFPIKNNFWSKHIKLFFFLMVKNTSGKIQRISESNLNMIFCLTSILVI